MLTNLFFYFRTAKNVGHVDLFQRFIDAADFILREDNVGGAAVFLEAAQVRRTRDGDDPGLFAKHPGQEHLCFTLPPAHPLASRKGLHLTDLNGETMLLRPNLGFWGPIVKQAMPETKFLIQENEAFNELVKFSVLPSFVTDLSLRREGPPPDRVVVPIADSSVQVTYYACFWEKTGWKLKKALTA